MKTKQTFIISAILLLSSFAVKAQFKAGAGIHYATDLNSIGISLNAQYDINDDWAATGAYTYFLEKDYVKWSALDFNANYNFTEIGENGKLYGIGGLNITMVKINIPELNAWLGDATTSDSNIGFNLGVGASFDLSDKISLAPEAMYTISSGGYLRIGAKVMYAF